MTDEGLDALVVRAPDNVLYLTNFWGMKGYEAVVFPREGEPVLICLEASAEDATRDAWTDDVRFLRGYVDDDPRPPTARTLELLCTLLGRRLGDHVPPASPDWHTLMSELVRELQRELP